MYSNSKIAKAVRLAMMIGAGTAAAVSAPAFSAEEESVERIEVTGSAIKRTDIEGALPVSVISQQDIVRSGVTSVPDLMNHIPQMQGFTAAGESVGGGGGGIQTASLRDLGSQYTLVLLNGRRMAAADSGGTVDLNSIPLSAIERVEVLLDGASALYGSDAIAGVVNFILKKDLQETNLTLRGDKPQKKGGESANFSISTGFGDIDSDGFNVLLAYSRDEQKQLKSVDRDFAKTGFLPFSYNGQEYVSINGSSNAIPGNAYLTFSEASGLAGKSLNPYNEVNGSCHDTSAPSGTACQFDYTSTLEIEPESSRDNIFVQGVAALGDDHEVYGTGSFSRFAMTSRIAPYPTGTFTLPVDSSVVQENVIPHLSAAEVDALEVVKGRWRTLPGGNRTNEYASDTAHFVAGLRGVVMDDIDYDLAYTHASSKREDSRTTGYPLEKELMDLITTGQVNVFAAPEDLSDDQAAAVKGAMYSGLWDTTNTKMQAIEGKASMPIFDMAAGEAYAAFGFDYRKTSYDVTISEANRNAVILFESPGDEFDLSRDTYGMFGELVVPVIEGLEVTGALRYDNIGKVTDKRRDGNQVVNEDTSDTTYKLSFTYRPTDELLVRGSYGTGFKAPSMRQIAEPRIEFGVTSEAYDCPLTGTSHPLKDLCYSDKLQYDVYREGYAKLKPEKSEQFSVGFVYSGSEDFSVGADYWAIQMTDQVSRLTQKQIMSDPVTYADLYTTKLDRGTGDDVLAIIQSAVNIGKANTSGIDWNVTAINEIGSGSLKTGFAGTLMLEAESLRPGTEGIYDSSLGKVGTNGTVTFRHLWNFTNTYTVGDFDLTANIRYRSGYEDVETTACLASDWADCGHAVQLKVKPYILTDVLASYNFNSNLNLGLGINNLLDEKAPLTLNGDAGHQVGYDPRYSSAYGRTFYMTLSYTL